MTVSDSPKQGAHTGGHTPGPWSIDGQGIRALVRGADLTIVATRHRLDAKTHEANAALIAAAPEFFESAKRLIEAWDARTTAAQQIVTGKSDRDLQKQAMDAIEGLRAAIAKATPQSEGAEG